MVEEDLEKHPEIVGKLGNHLKRFIKWAAWERLNYNADIVEEYLDFKNTIIDKRKYTENVTEWRAVRKQIFERDNYTCLYCNKKGGKLEVDHIVPLSRGGNNDTENLTTSCQKCNRQKRDKMVDEFHDWRIANDSL